ncbi:MAG: hypothetical protein CL677_01155 [Bdellovibrionaceae bacterium]|nr:hypothetical protein [Pseudobdellovibrionaceae bacterium]|tara:strand:- start:156759 stop:157106 length:348 start_codon:yes stop_codon:yes gene_type:complete
MAQLINTSKDNRVIADNLSIAETFIDRGVGLLGKKTMQSGEALWIKNCFDVHTFFMSFPIDVVFLDKEMKVKDVRKNLRPWRMAFSPGSNSVIEFFGGTVKDEHLTVGDQLNVGG